MPDLSTSLRYTLKNLTDIFATGGRDGNIYIWDARSMRISADGDTLPDNSIMNCHLRNGNADYKHLAFSSFDFVHSLNGIIVLGINIKNSQKQTTPPSITCLVYQDEHTLISCADKDS